MGCMCSIPCSHSFTTERLSSLRIKADDAAGTSLAQAGPPTLALAAAQLVASTTQGAAPPDRILTPREVLEMAAKVVYDNFRDELDAVTLASVALIESSGYVNASRFNDDTCAASIGLCQMTLPTASWLATARRYDLYGTMPSRSDLEDPTCSLYYCAAYLVTLAAPNDSDSLDDVAGIDDVEEFRVRAYHAGPKSWQSEGTAQYWARFLRAKQQLGRLHEALTAGVSEHPSGTTMHVVRTGESLAKIAHICDVTVEQILAVNPDIPDASCIQANDCIALPVPRLLPRLYAIRPGDTLPSIAKAQGVPLPCLLSQNPGLREPRAVLPGWVLALPGLRGEGDSQPDTPLGSPRLLNWHQALPSIVPSSARLMLPVSMLELSLPAQPAWSRSSLAGMLHHAVMEQGHKD